jgi:hypothetical protein
MDRLYINSSDKTLLPVTATPRWLRPTKYLDPYVQTPAFTIAGASDGVGTEPCNDLQTTPGAKPLNIVGGADGNYIYVRHVDFGASLGAKSVHLRVATPQAGASIAIYSSMPPSLPSSQPPPSLITECTLPQTGDLQAWTTVTCAIPNAKRASHVQSEIHFAFRCPSCSKSTTSVVNFNWWKFDGGRASGVLPPATEVPVQIKARGAGRRYLAADNNIGNGAVNACATARNATGTKFKLIDNDDGSWGIATAAATGHKLLCVDKDTGKLFPAKMPLQTSKDCTKFRLQPTVDGSWALQSYVNRLWLEVNVALVPIGARGVECDGTGLVKATAEDPRGLLRDAGRFDFVEI